MLSLLAPEAKLVGAVALAAAVVSVPARAWPLFIAVFALVVALVTTARVGARWVAARAAVLVPFLVLAALLPFVALGERLHIGWAVVSREGLVAAGLLAARSVVALGIALCLVASTTAADLTEGLARLRLPAPLVLVLSLMVRYLGVVTDDVRRMAVARASRGGGRGIAGTWVVTASGVGRLFVRSYERGERVHLAMVSRGYDGTPPATTRPGSPAWHWVVCLGPAVLTGLLAWGWPA